MQRDLSDLQQEKAETLQSYKDIAQTNELSLRELAKLYSSSTLHVMQLKLQIWIRQIISYIDNSAWISRINDAHIDFLYDLGM
ncbi:MAG: hypothetical protein H6765_06520 [Candidatus Peribacteria bacterium]|nr:MAG: hypothetical protein H6765_06520 [Candidatus Peribacteria bacterium]